MKDMRRAEIGHHHHLARAYLLRYAQEASWREDNRRLSNGEQVAKLAPPGPDYFLADFFDPHSQSSTPRRPRLGFAQGWRLTSREGNVT
jgi:hypothetical protein